MVTGLTAIAPHGRLGQIRTTSAAAERDALVEWSWGRGEAHARLEETREERLRGDGRWRDEGGTGRGSSLQLKDKGNGGFVASC